MSQVAENVIPVPEVIEHFGDAKKVLARLMKPAAVVPVDLVALREECVSATWVHSGSRVGRLYEHAVSDLDHALRLQNNGGSASKLKRAIFDARQSVETARSFARASSRRA